jgi:hypothetical protein
MKSVSILFTAIFLFFSAELNAQVKYTNQTTDVKKGPAAYHELIIRLLKNSQVEVDSTYGYWERILYEDTKGWVPSYVLSLNAAAGESKTKSLLNQRMQLLYKELDNKSDVKDELAVSATQVTAAIKGFSKKYRERFKNGYTVEIDEFLIDTAPSWIYEAFSDKRDRRVRRRTKRTLLYPPGEGVRIPANNPEVDQMGYAIASRIAQNGLFSNYQVQLYLELLTAHIIEETHREDLFVKVLILDTDEVQGYTIPGNFIFVSKGALMQMQNEAELVHFLAHEIAHLVFNHGTEEYTIREPKIRTADAFAELEAEMGEPQTEREKELAAIDDELSSMADEIYDYVNKGRLEEYEYAADRWGLVYTYLAGFDPSQSINFLDRIDSNLIEKRGEWDGLKLDERKKRLREQLKELKLEGGTISTPQEFDNFKRDLEIN